jgi:hypothetical protein
MRWIADGSLEPPRTGESDRVAPRTIVVLGSLRLWAGERPMMIGPLLRRARLGWNRESASALARALWAAVSPGSLRGAIRLRDRLRDATRGRGVDDRAVYEWRPVRRPAVEAPRIATGEAAPGTAG